MDSPTTLLVIYSNCIVSKFCSVEVTKSPTGKIGLSISLFLINDAPPEIVIAVVESIPCIVLISLNTAVFNGCPDKSVNKKFNGVVSGSLIVLTVQTTLEESPTMTEVSTEVS